MSGRLFSLSLFTLLKNILSAMKLLLYISIGLASCLLWCRCGGGTQEPGSSATDKAALSAVQDDVSKRNIVQVAMSSPNHTTLVTAVKAAGLVDALSNPGPFTVFAPTDEAFAKLPAGTVESLLKPENKATLSDILEYHTFVGVIRTEQMRDGQRLNQVNLKNIVLSVQDGKVKVNGKANILASVPASNGIIHVIDEVLLPE
jgi:uncharacterized surface protein with fasciclin (FAS1) repeats